MRSACSLTNSTEFSLSMQHYNPVIDAAVRKAYSIPEHWILRAQMPFGSIEAGTGDKTFIADSERFMVLS
jgi:predicted oxidoreductase (fatty acid repression mutant protein)